MIRILACLLFALVTYLGIFYMENFQPEILSAIFIRIDIFDLTQAAKEEHKRLNDIKNLTIPYEEKQVLANHNVFMGASQDMMRLALGEPKKTWEDKQSSRFYYAYFLPNDKHPTVFVFESDKLVSAYKGSAIARTGY